LQKKILDKYKERFLKSLPEIQRPHAKFDSAPYVSVPFALAAEFRDVKIDRKVLLDLTETRLNDFKKIYDSMDELVMQPIKDELQKVETPKKRNRLPRKAKNNSQNSEVAETPAKPVISEQTKDKPVGKGSNTSKTPPESPAKEKKQKHKSEFNSTLLVNEEEITTQQVELDIEEFAHNDGKDPTLPKVLRDKKRQREYQEWKEKALANRTTVPRGKTKQLSLDSFTQPTKKQKLDSKKDE